MFKSRPCNICLMLCLALLLSFGCSNSSDNPVESVEVVSDEVRGTENEGSHVLWGIWTISFDLEKMEVSIVPDRTSLIHFNITDMVNPPQCDDCIAIVVNSFDTVTRELDADVTLRNQFPVTGYDVRGILYTNVPGHLLLNADNWTDLYDVPGGHSAGINPFRMFAKAAPNHVFNPGAAHTENYIVHIPTPPQFVAIRYAVDASWPGNCKEPYVIENFSQPYPMYNVAGYETPLLVNVRDWQNDVDVVELWMPLITGEPSVQFSDNGADLWMTVIENFAGVGPGDYTGWVVAKSEGSCEQALYHEVTVTVTEALTPVVTSIDPDHGTTGEELLDVVITGDNFQSPGLNVLFKKAGEPSFTAMGKDVVDSSTIICDVPIPPGQAVGLYDVEVTNPSGLVGTGVGLFEVLDFKPYYPVDVTPEWINFTPNDVAIYDHYALLASRWHGVQIIDIDNPSYPVWVANLPVDDEARGIDVVGELAFVVDYNAGLKIFSIATDNFGELLGSVPYLGQAHKVEVQDGYAYVASYSSGLKIIDIDPPEVASVVATVLTGTSHDVSVGDGYAYVAAGYDGFRIVDIDPIGEASIVKTIDIGSDIYEGVSYRSGYAYVARGVDGLVVVDVEPAGDASVVQTVDTGKLLDIVAEGNYAYGADRDDGLVVFDISTPESTSEVTSLDTGSWSYALTVDHDYAYIADPHVGLRIINKSVPSVPVLEGTAYGLGYAKDVECADGYAYVADQRGGMFVLGAYPPPASFFIGAVDTAETKGLCVQGDYVYLADWTSDFKIIDITNPVAPVISKEIPTSGVSYECVLDNGYIYLANGTTGLEIIDVDPVGDASIVKNIPTTDRAIYVAVSGGYAYVSDEDDGLKIIDIDPIGDASVVHSIPTTGIARGIVVDSNYAYLAESIDGLLIIDITTPESASVEKTVTLPGSAKGVFVDGEFAYITCSAFGLQVVDINPVGDAYIFSWAYTPDNATNVWVEDNYAFVADEWGGLRVIELW